MIWEIYRDTAREWRWRLKSTNGQTIGDSGEGYTRRSHCVAMVKRIMERAPGARIEMISPSRAKS